MKADLHYPPTRDETDMQDIYITPHLLRDQAMALRKRSVIVKADAAYAMSKDAARAIHDAALDLLRQAQEKEREAAELEAALAADERVQRYG